jgi:hypothetical protein
VGAVEDADLAALRQCRVDAPEEVVRELGRRRGFERDRAAALGVDTGEDLADDTVLARGIEALEDQEEAVLPLG